MYKLEGVNSVATFITAYYLFIFYIFFFFDLGFMALSRKFHLYRADRSSKVGENWRTGGKTTYHL